jgi:hypothetical protein
MSIVADTRAGGFVTSVAPIFLISGFVSLVSKTATALVGEKETRAKEAMKMMGLRTSVWWAGWWVTSGLIATSASVLITAIGFKFTIFVYSSAVLVFATIALFAISLVMFTSALSAFFDKSRTAGQFVSIIYFLLGYVPSLLLTPDTSIGARQVRGWVERSQPQHCNDHCAIIAINQSVWH